ncbi:MAG: enoyl-CoA hydratase/isomerase family protein [Cytophagaceae bacterium]|jgi:2-(1,2-epoxy-1,2-dihydrophenyl)acetyl-CoA isomerase|nr:enoyl-CoA hydratase/isomerase family protein [Cytophagaceae bacterium]
MYVEYITMEHGVEIRLNQPESYNALFPEFIEAIVSAFNKAEADKAIQYILFTASGKGFCSGLDLKWAATIPTSDVQHIVEKYFNVLAETIFNCSKMTFCYLQGVASGAGASLVLACDWIIGNSSATIHLPFLQLGLMPDTGMSFLLTRRVGYAKSIQLLAECKKITVSELEHLGIVQTIVKEKEDIYLLIQQLPNHKLQALKQLLQPKHNLSSALQQEAIAQHTIMQTGEYKEKLNAFLNKTT